jgi:hypothetical protein
MSPYAHVCILQLSTRVCTFSILLVPFDDEPNRDLAGQVSAGACVCFFCPIPSRI